MSWQTLLLSSLLALEKALIAYVLAIGAIQLTLLFLGWALLRRRQDLSATDRDVLMRSPLAPPISILAPAHNEAASVIESARAMLTLNYPDYEVVIINDGSKDETLQVLVDEFHLYKSSRVPTGGLTTKAVRAIYESRDPIRLVVIDKENGGKADALNVGLNYARTPLVAAVDSDSLLEPDALFPAVKPFMDDPRVVAVGGMVRAANGCQIEAGQITRMTAPPAFIALLQSMEYLRAFLGARIGLSFVNALLIISGAFGVFRRDLVVDVGGFLANTIGEDMELVVRLHHRLRAEGRDYRIPFVPQPVCWTEVPESWKVLQRQRNRWQRGAMDSLWLHRRILFNRKFGSVGLFAVPYFLFFEVLAPVAELIGYVLIPFELWLGRISTGVAVGFLVIAVMFGIVLSVGGIVLDLLTTRQHPAVRDVLRLFGAGVIENFGPRQAIAVWRLKGLYDWFRGNQSWGVMERRGFGQAAGKPAAAAQ
jgi:cellulose synthase/poly-beta-1,6-N-acetylglucosamine synthase-like glycosyltransferase